ncbi:ankyrin repeat-containing domain protein [Delphinella strobiligena]|nr:ankyrin repeat-containing domain protein [Delphinella strobiligena]
MDHSSLSVLADAASDVFDTKKRVASNRVLSECAQCHKSWPTALALEIHAKKTHHEAWICSVAGCGVGFTNRTAFSKHTSRHNNPDREYPCLECGHIFPRKDNLFEHRAIQGRCKPSKSYEAARCSPDRSKRRKLNNHIQRPPAPEVLDDSIPTAIVTSQQPRFFPSIENSDHSWPQLPIEPVIDTGSRVSSISHIQAGKHTYMPVGDQSSTGHSEKSSLGTETSNENGQLHVTPDRLNAYPSPGHLALEHVDDNMHTGTTNSAVLCKESDHAGGGMHNNHSILPDKANDAVNVIALPSFNSMNGGILSSDKSEANVDPSPAESGVIDSQQEPPWLTWLRERREAIKLRGGYYQFPKHNYDFHEAMKLQVVLELALLYYGDHHQDLHDIMSRLSVAAFLKPKEQLKQEPIWHVHEAAIEECRTALIPDLPTLCSFFGRDLAVGTGPHQALWSYAVICSQNEIVELLLEKGAHPDQEVVGMGVSDRIPLVVARDCGNWDLAKVLLKSGANPDVSDDYEQSVLSIAAKYCKPEVVKLLLEKKANPNLSGRSNACRMLLSAISDGYTEIVELLLQQGVDVNIEIYESRGYCGKFGSHCTPLLLAITEENIGIVNLLLENGANPDGQHEYHIPLLVAVGAGCIEIVELLLDKGADMNLKRYDTALGEGEFHYY